MRLRFHLTFSEVESVIVLGNQNSKTAFLFTPFAIAIGLMGSGTLADSMPVNPNTLPKEREIHNTFSENGSSGGILGATNPMELINRIKQSTAFDNATSPSDAIDEALNALEDDNI